MKSYAEAKQLAKADLIEEYRKLLEEYEDLEGQYNDLDECYAEAENSAYESNKKLEELTKPTNTNTTIVSVEDFILQMKKDNIWNDQIEEFLKSYMRYYNKVD